MTRFAIDAPTALEIARGALTVGEPHGLVGPGRLRSDALSLLYADYREGALSRTEMRAMLDALASLKMRALADRVTRALAWQLADELGWKDTAKAEYLAPAVLHADAFVTVDAELVAAARDRIRIAHAADLAS